MITLDHAYIVTGLMFLAFAGFTLADRDHPTRFRSALFWGLIAASMLFGTYLGDLGNGVLVLGLVALVGLRKLGAAVEEGADFIRVTPPAAWTAASRRWEG